ncbi:hypothetical protein [Bradyrhizobium sp. CCBAU 51627]|uniref:hypothetical protein n=1 Tax=Bradyrhizobium sp. CCBAU 51627 TaxID=1325088 RepID=UPI0023053066|nr:hypothetical protein [Bradyrhizobium sp. CCBAU 51627]MDA9434409.1 hypothetical protein [Bradyrhizobium sp. CCBAU 51627]
MSSQGHNALNELTDKTDEQSRRIADLEVTLTALEAEMDSLGQRLHRHYYAFYFISGLLAGGIPLIIRSMFSF